jgi:hypothetical protein
MPRVFLREQLPIHFDSLLIVRFSDKLRPALSRAQIHRYAWNDLSNLRANQHSPPRVPIRVRCRFEERQTERAEQDCVSGFASVR